MISKVSDCLTYLMKSYLNVLYLGVDRLDKDLTIGQMQGKFTLHVQLAVL